VFYSYFVGFVWITIDLFLISLIPASNHDYLMAQPRWNEEELC